MHHPHQSTQQQPHPMLWPNTDAQPHQSPFARHTTQQPQSQSAQHTQAAAMQFPDAQRWPQQQQPRSLPPPPPFPLAASSAAPRTSSGINLRYPQAQLQIRAFPPQRQQQAAQQTSFASRSSPATFVQRNAGAAAASTPNAARFAQQPPPPPQYAMAPFPPVQPPRISMNNGMRFPVAAAAPSPNRFAQQPRPPAQRQQPQPPHPTPPQTPLQVGFMSGGRFIPSTPQTLPAAAFAAPFVPQQQQRPIQPLASPPPPPLPSSISWRFDHSQRRWMYEPLGRDRMMQPISERVGANKQYIADQLYWSRDMYRSLCEMLKEAEKMDTNKLTVWSKGESASIDNQLWHRSVPSALLHPAHHFGVGSALLSSGTREWMPALGVDMSRPPVLKLVGRSKVRPTHCKFTAKKAARVNAALLQSQRVAPPIPPSAPQSDHEVPDAMILSDRDDDSIDLTFLLIFRCAAQM